MAGAAAVDLDSPANRALAREMAERSVVLLDAGSALPLLGDGRPALRRVAVVGPCAADPRTFMGCYAFPNHVLPRHPGLGLGIEVPTAVEALRAELPGVEVVHEQGCQVPGEDRSGFAAALAAAREADLCVAVVGDLAGLFGHGSSGEGCDAEDLRLPGVQAELLDELLADRDAGGRGGGLRPPLRARRRARPRRRPGPGVHARRGGRAGDRRRPVRPDPAQRQAARADPAASRRAARHLPPAAARRPESAGISNLDPTPLFPFGYGGSYTTFEVDDLRISDAEVPTDGEFTVSVRVRNTGPRDGRRGRAALPARRRRPGRPAGAAAGRVRPGRGWSPARLPTCSSGCTPTGPPSPSRELRADRRARRHRGARRHIGRGPALPRSCPADRPAAGGRPRPPAGHAGGTRPGRERRRRGVGERRASWRQGRTRDAGHGRGVAGRIRRDRLQGAQRPQ